MVEVGKYTPLFNGKLLEFELVSNLAFTLTADLDSTSCFKENKIPLIDLVSVKYLIIGMILYYTVILVDPVL